MNAEQLRELYEKAGIESMRKQTLESSPLSPEQRNELEHWISEKWDGFLRLIGPIDDEQENRKTLINQYIGLKSHWFMLNTMLQFSLFQYGEADEMESYRSSILSELVAFLKSFLTDSEAGIIDKFLAEPLARELGDAGSELNRVGTMAEQVGSLEAQLNDIYAEREELVKDVGTARPEEIASMISSLEAQLNILYEERDHRKSVSGSPSSPALDAVPASSDHELMVESLEEQLNALYEERETLGRELGVTEADEIVHMVSGMDEQLRSLYDDMQDAVVIEGRQVTIMGSRKVIIKKKK